MLKLPSLPSNRDHAPRPHSAADGLPAAAGPSSGAAAAVSANALPASSSPAVMVRGSSGVPAIHRASASISSRSAAASS